MLPQVVLNVISAADAIVGKYELSVNEFKAGEFYLIFNPWCSGNSGPRSAAECVPFMCGPCVTPEDVPTLAPSLQCRVPEPLSALLIHSNQPAEGLARHSSRMPRRSSSAQARKPVSPLPFRLPSPPCQPSRLLLPPWSVSSGSHCDSFLRSSRVGLEFQQRFLLSANAALLPPLFLPGVPLSLYTKVTQGYLLFQFFYF